MAQAIEIVKNYEATVKNLSEYKSAASDTTASTMHYVKKNEDTKHECSKCGTRYGYGQCPAFGTTCKKCTKPNHWAKMCRSSDRPASMQKTQNKPFKLVKSKQINQNAHPKKRQNKVRIHDLLEVSTDEDTFNISSLGIDSQDSREEIFSRIKAKAAEKKHITMNLKVKLDTGANANILTLRSFRQMYPDKVTSDNTISANFVNGSGAKLVGYSGEQIKHLGTVILTCGEDKTPQKFYIVHTDGPNILGLQGCRSLNLIKVNCNINRQVPIKTVEDLKSSHP
ncbi:hypothetical protein RRG08_001455 [Elysia crispata]|uniref:Peptidase A2 domain-containing protein n=1 Tax=Elysia crispata TaxID=231223 RepID=A0AAE1DLE4_9GAST|nr:hypothetical protein RRG08_001455 [Elysia crispata]